MNQQQIETIAQSLKARQITEFLQTKVGAVPAGWSKLSIANKRKHLVDIVMIEEGVVSDFEGEFGHLIDDSSEGAGDTDLAPHDSTSGATGAIVASLVESAASEVAGLSPKDSLTNLRENAERLEEYHFRLGALLSHMQATEAHLALGYNNLRELVSEETSLEYRKAMYLVSNYRQVTSLGIPAESLSGVTWTKLRDVLPVLTSENYDEWLEVARTKTTSEIRNLVTAAKAQAVSASPQPGEEGEDSDSAPVPAHKQKGFFLYEDQAILVESALEKAKVEANVDTMGAALAAMAAAYTGQAMPKTVADAVKPDISDEGVRNMVAEVYAAEKKGNFDQLIRILNIVVEFWSDVDINLDTDAATNAA